MNKGRYFTFSTLPVAFRDSSRWRSVDDRALSDSDRQRFLTLKAAVEAYLQSGALVAISKEMRVAPSEVLRSFRRCVSLRDDGDVEGWPALIRHLRLVRYTRNRPQPTCVVQGRGQYSGAFTKFLDEHPRIRESIEDLVLKKTKSDLVHEARVTIKSLHATFVQLCLKEGISLSDYPLNTGSKGRRSLGRYVELVMAQHLDQATRARYGKEAAKRLSTGTGYASPSLVAAPYDVVGMDAHKIDCIGTVKVVGPGGPQRIAIKRLWYIPVLDFYSRAILGYTVAIRTECSAATAEEALVSALTTWEPRKLKIPGMSYNERAGLPSGVFPELRGIGWTTMKLDNAAIHYAAAIADRARRRLGCSINFGPLGHWEHRAVLERLFATLEGYGFQRLPSSTGSGPNDPARDQPVKNAVDIGIDWEVLLDLVDVITANYNATKHGGIGSQRPLDVLGEALHRVPSTFFPRPLPPANSFHGELGVEVLQKTVRGNKETGRRPYVEIYGVRYTSPILASSMGLINKKILVHIGKNIQTVMAYFASGEELGILTAGGWWGRTAHTREIRQQIHVLRDAGEIEVGPGDDPIKVAMSYYASKAHKEAEKAAYKISKNATKLAHLSKETGVPIPTLAPEPAPAQAHRQVLEEPMLSPFVSSPVWKTII